MNYLTKLFVLFFAMVGVTVAQQTSSIQSISQKIKRFVPTPIAANVSALTPGDRKALQKLVEAAAYIDSIYLEQAWSGNLALLHQLRGDQTPAGKERLHYFLVNMGPWSVLDGDEPFIDGVPKVKPAGANLYPVDMTKDEFNAWVNGLSTDALKEQARGYFTAIRRNKDGQLYAVPYSEEYKRFLLPAAQLLREAATLTGNASLKTFLTKRADAFLSNDYYDSDVAWLDLDSPIEPTIGPYEVYMDGLFNYKAAFEAFIALRDDAETAKLASFSRHLQDVENNLPIDPQFRNPQLGALSPIRVVDEVVTGGESRAGIQTAAFNLPNDERILKEKGSKRVMLKNVQEAKFNSILTPIAAVAVAADQRSLIGFDPFFTHILAHELMHGLGPHSITVDGRKTTVREQMQDLSSALEEAKADISGLFALQFLIDQGVVDKSLEQKFYVTYLAGAFRSVRFGLNDAHAKGMAMQFNYLSDLGAFKLDPSTETYSINFSTVKDAVRKLTGEIMTIQARGDYEAAKKLLDTYGNIRPGMQKLLDKLSAIPVDIEPIFSPVE